MKLLVCGGRDYADKKRMYELLDDFHRHYPVDILIQGGAPGADRMAMTWAMARGVHFATVPALWDTHGNGAGPKRNAVMLLLRPDIVIAFPGNVGTPDMVSKSNAALITTYEVDK